MKNIILTVLFFNIFQSVSAEPFQAWKHCTMPWTYNALQAETNKVDGRIKKMLDGLKNKDIELLEEGYGEIKEFRLLKKSGQPIGNLMNAGTKECKRYK
jgi:hypothetical protein